ncbi:MAG: hypothetical protein KF809_11115 [Chloroflexi bacterium]|nr:hypothetical protein [Chloroflexota bacterium]
MRLPWPFRRSAPEGDIAVPRDRVDGAATGAVPPVGRSEWREVGSLRPSFTGDPGIRVQRFRADLAGSQLPPPILGPLGHARDADGPAGLVSGLTRPVVGGAHPTTGAGGMRLDLRPQRGRPTVQRAAAEPDVDAGPVVTSAPGPETNDGPAPSRLPGLPELPVRHATPIVGATSRSGPLLTVARTPQLVGAPTPSPAPTPVAVAQAADGLPVGALATLSAGGRTIVRGPGGSRVRLGAPIQRDAQAATSGAPSVGASTPSARAVDRIDPLTQAPTPDAPLVGTLRSAIDPSSHTPDASAEAAPVIPGGLVLARAVHASEASGMVVAKAGSSASGSGADHGPGDHIGGPSARSAPSAPLVGSTPLEPTSWPLATPTSGRAAANAAPSLPSTTRGASTPTRATVQRLPATPGTPTTVAIGTPSPVGRPDAPSRAAPSTHPLPSVIERTPHTDAATLVPIRRAVPMPAPSPAIGSVGDPGASPRTIQRHTADPTGSPSVTSAHQMDIDDAPTLQLARVAAPPAHHTAHGIGGTSTTPSIRGAGATVADRTGQRSSVIQRAPADDGAGPESLDPAPSVEPAAVSASAPAAATSPLAGLADRDLDEMVRRLYPRLRRTLSSELLVARERAGVLADLR